jgi:septum formation protein
MSRSIVLASGSPRRKALLKDLGISVLVRVSDADETGTGTPDEVVVQNALLKCEAVTKDAVPDEIVIAADTIVVLGDKILGKPKSLEEATRMLEELSGKTHEVKTGVSVWNGTSGEYVNAIETTYVTFRDLSQHEISRFVEIVQPLDRAGAYTVDGPGSLLVSGYMGCYHNVLGLPLVLLHGILLKFGYDLFGNMSEDTARFL